MLHIFVSFDMFCILCICDKFFLADKYPSLAMFNFVSLDIFCSSRYFAFRLIIIYLF